MMKMQSSHNANKSYRMAMAAQHRGESTNESNNTLETFTILPIDEDRAPMKNRNVSLHTEGGFTIDFSKMFGNK